MAGSAGAAGVNPAVGAAAISASGGIFSNIFAARRQRRQNKFALQMNQMNNNFNAQQAEKQMAFQRDMWREQRDWNTPENQRKLREQAGFNPYMDSGASQFGVASGAPSGAAASSGAVNVPQAYQPDTSFIGQLADIFAKKDLLQSQSESMHQDVIGKSIDNASRQLRNITEINQIIADTKNKGVQRDLMNLQKDWMPSVYNASVNLQQKQADAMQVKIEGDMIHNAISRKELNIFDDQAKMQLSEMAANIALKYASRDLTLKQCTTEVNRAISEAAKASSIHISNKQQSAITDALVESTLESLENQKLGNAMLRKDLQNYNYNKYASPIIQGFGAMLPFAKGLNMLKKVPKVGFR